MSRPSNGIKGNKFTCKIADAGNTWKPCLYVLYMSGCSLRHVYYEEDDANMWIAGYNGREFVSSDPVALLGLFSMWKTYGDEWRTHKDWKMEEDIIFERLLCGETVKKADKKRG